MKEVKVGNLYESPDGEVQFLVETFWRRVFDGLVHMITFGMFRRVPDEHVPSHLRGTRMYSRVATYTDSSQDFTHVLNQGGFELIDPIDE